MGRSILLYDYECRLADGRQLRSIRRFVDTLLVDRSSNLHPSVVALNERVITKEVKFYVHECDTVVLYYKGTLVGCAMLDIRQGRNTIEHIVLDDRNSVGSGMLMYYILCEVFPGEDVYVNVKEASLYKSAVEERRGVFKIVDKMAGMLTKTIGDRVHE